MSTNLYGSNTFYYHIVNGEKETDNDFWKRVSSTLNDMSVSVISFESVYSLNDSVHELFNNLNPNNFNNTQTTNNFDVTNIHKYFNVIGCKVYYKSL